MADTLWQSVWSDTIYNGIIYFFVATAAAETITEAAAVVDTEITTIITEEETIIVTITEMIAVEAAVAAEIVVDAVDRDRFQRNLLTLLM